MFFHISPGITGPPKPGRHTELDRLSLVNLGQCCKDIHRRSRPWPNKSEKASRLLVSTPPADYPTLPIIPLLTSIPRNRSQPQRIESAKDSCAYSLSGSSWFLSLLYLYLGPDSLATARALILHGSFMRQCVDTPIETIAELCRDDDSKALDCHLPIYASGFRACKTKESMLLLLERAMPIDYRRRMAFAGQKNNKLIGNIELLRIS